MTIGCEIKIYPGGEVESDWSSEDSGSGDISPKSCPEAGFLGTPAPKASTYGTDPQSARTRTAVIDRLAEVVDRHLDDRLENMQLRKMARGRTARRSKTLPKDITFQDLVKSIAHPEADLRDNTCIFFDWDDTLFPTWYVDQMGGACSQPGMMPEFLESMAKHVESVKELLRTARKVARVAIVTLAARPWIDSMASKYWHDFDFEEFLSELDIPVFYAREHISKAEKSKGDEGGVNLYVVAKRNAMCKCLKRLRKKTGRMANNIISFGDSNIEHEALRELVWCMDSGIFAKSVLFSYEPTMGTLTDELRVLTPVIGRMVAIQDDFELNMESESDLSHIVNLL